VKARQIETAVMAVLGGIPGFLFGYFVHKVVLTRPNAPIANLQLLITLLPVLVAITGTITGGLTTYHWGYGYTCTICKERCKVTQTPSTIPDMLRQASYVDTGWRCRRCHRPVHGECYKSKIILTKYEPVVCVACKGIGGEPVRLKSQ
jgi:hypothetical protein